MKEKQLALNLRVKEIKIEKVELEVWEILNLIHHTNDSYETFKDWFEQNKIMPYELCMVDDMGWGWNALELEKELPKELWLLCNEASDNIDKFLKTKLKIVKSDYKDLI